MDFTNGAQLHLIVNHIPVICVPVVALLLAWGLLRSQPEVTRAALGLLALVAAAVLLPYLTGEPAEEVVEEYGVSHDFIHQHEEFAEATALATGVLAVLAVGALVLSRRPFRRWPGVVVLVAALGASGMLAWTAHLGGQVRHLEIRPGAPAAEAEGGVPIEVPDTGDGGGGDDRDRSRAGDD